MLNTKEEQGNDILFNITKTSQKTTKIVRFREKQFVKCEKTI